MQNLDNVKRLQIFALRGIQVIHRIQSITENTENIYISFHILEYMSSDRKIIINYILSFISLVAIFIISGYYSDLENLILISSFFPIVFIPIMLLFASEKSYVKGKEGLYLAAMFFSVIFYISIVTLKKPEIISSQNIGGVYLAILLISFIISIFIHAFSYNLIRFFGIRTDLKINETIRTISFPIIKNDAKLARNLINFFLEEILLFEYDEKIDNETYKFQRNEREYILLKYLENPNQSNLLISFFMFYDDQDGVDAFKSEKMDSLSIILEKFLGGNVIATPEENAKYFNSYFLRYIPIINRISKYFGENKINLSDIKSPLILSTLLIVILYMVFNYEKIAQFVFSFDTDILIKLMAIAVGLPASLYYILKILGKIK